MANWGPHGLTAAKLPDGQMQLWAADVSGRIWSAWRLKFGWNFWQSPWTPSLPTFASHAMVAAPLSDKRLQFWALDTEGQIWSCNQLTTDPDSSWTEWTSQWTPQAPLFSTTQVAAAPLSDKRLQFWALDTEGQLWSCKKSTTDPNSLWTEWTTQWASSPPFACTQIAVAPLSDKRLQFWAVDNQGVAWTCGQKNPNPDAPWGGWAFQWTADLPPPNIMQVAVAPLSDGRLQFWAVDGSGWIYSCRQKSKDLKTSWNWTEWTARWMADLQMFAAQTLWPARLSDGRMQVWIIDNQGQLRTTYQITDDAEASWVNWNLVFSMMKQEQSEWCWLACGNATSHFYDPASEWTQCTMANAALQKDNCCSDPKSCNKPGTLTNALRVVGNFASVQAWPAAQADITDCTQKGQPLGVHIKWDHDTVGHEVILTGGGANDMVYVKDPLYGSSFITYDTLKNHYQGGDTEWTTTFFTEP